MNERSEACFIIQNKRKKADLYWRIVFIGNADILMAAFVPIHMDLCSLRRMKIISNE